MEGLGTGGKLGLFRSPEPNGEAAPAIFGVFLNTNLSSSASLSKDPANARPPLRLTSFYRQKEMPGETLSKAKILSYVEYFEE